MRDLDFRKIYLPDLNIATFQKKPEPSGEMHPLRAANRFMRFWILGHTLQDRDTDGNLVLEFATKSGTAGTVAHPGWWVGEYHVCPPKYDSDLESEIGETPELTTDDRKALATAKLPWGHA